MKENDKKDEIEQIIQNMPYMLNSTMKDENDDQINDTPMDQGNSNSNHKN